MIRFRTGTMALITSSMLLTGLLSACAAAAGEGLQTAASAEVVLTEEASAASSDVDEAGPPPPKAFHDAPPLIVDEAGLMSEDDRAADLVRLTDRWGTDWTRHTVRYEEILAGQIRDGIPSIDAPEFVSPEAAREWLADNEPVMVIDLGGEARAYPLQILMFHEIVNDIVGGIPVAVTFCPLCNSAIVFDARLGEFEFEFGTSGLLRHSDLIMYDRSTETLWQQLTGEAIVGRLAGARLRFLPSSLVSFGTFRDSFPDGKVLSRATGRSAPYGSNPYVGYDSEDNSPFLFAGIADERLPAMARVVSTSQDGIDMAYPLELVSRAGAINDTIGDRPIVVLHQFGTSSAMGAREIALGADIGATGLFDPVVDGQKLTFSRVGDSIVDDQTSSTWNILGRAVAGPLAGESLRPLLHGDHFWFSWAAFKPDTLLYDEDPSNINGTDGRG